MALRPPARYSTSASSGGVPGESGLSPLDLEIAGEKAAALGRAGDRVQASLLRLRQCDDAAERSKRLNEAASAVYAYFIQRELCGMRRHHDAIRDYAIPREVLARLGAS